MSTNEEDFLPNEGKYGLCPVCGEPLENCGAASSGDGDIYDEIRCSDEFCSYEGYNEHASYCHCPECDPYGMYDISDEEAEDENNWLNSDDISDEHKCRICGCTDNDCHQCIEKTGEPCHWVEDDLCSACLGEEKKQ